MFRRAGKIIPKKCYLDLNSSYKQYSLIVNRGKNNVSYKNYNLQASVCFEDSKMSEIIELSVQGLSLDTNKDPRKPIDDLLKFLKRNKWRNEDKLEVTEFPETGRGIRTNSRTFGSDEVLIDMPFSNVFISVITLMDDKKFRELCLEQLQNNNVTTQLLLAFYLLYQTHLGQKSIWRDYIESLPSSLSTPHFCTTPELDCVPMVRNLVRNSIHSLLSSFKSTFSSIICDCCQARVIDLFSADDLVLMYYLVNSRSVYCDPGTIRSRCNPIKFLSDEPNMALAPFLDFFNHSDRVAVESELYQDSASSELRYRLITKSPTGRGEQIFINYGSHDNFKLLIEYGFIIAGNCDEKIDLSLAQIADFLKAYPKYYHEKKMAFVRAKKIDSELFLSEAGLSYNLEVIFKIFKSAALTEKTLSELVFNKSTVPVDESVDFERDLYLYLRSRFEKSSNALTSLGILTDSGQMLMEFLDCRINLLDRLLST